MEDFDPKLWTNIDISSGGYPWLQDAIKGYLVVLSLVTAWFFIKAALCAARGEWDDSWVNVKKASLIGFVGFMLPAAIIILMAWFAKNKAASND